MTLILNRVSSNAVEILETNEPFKNILIGHILNGNIKIYNTINIIKLEEIMSEINKLREFE